VGVRSVELRVAGQPGGEGVLLCNGAKGDATKGTGRVYFGDGSCGRFVWYYSITFGEHGEVLNFEAVEIGETGE
jgi:hypothetical protein